MKTIKVLLLLLVLLLGGCFQLDLDFSDIFSELHFLPGVSLHPLYTEKEIIFEEKLLGSWGDDETKLTFEAIEAEDSYNLTFDIEVIPGEFVAHLVKFDDLLFLDLFPKKPDPNTVPFQQFLFVPTHLFLKIDQIEPELKIRMMDADKIIDFLEKDPNSLKHEIIEEYYVLLTASTYELQQFMKRHANDEVFFGEVETLERLKPRDPNSIGQN